MPASTAQRAKTAERRKRAIDMHLAGHTWQTIADKLGYATRGAAQKDVARALQVATQELLASAAELRDRDLLTLAAMQTAFMPLAMDGDDKAARVILRIMERRARYMGLDAAKTIKHVMTSELDERIEDLTNRMREAAGQQPR